MESKPSKVSDALQSLADQLEKLHDQKAKEISLTTYFHELVKAERDKSESHLLPGGGIQTITAHTDVDAESNFLYNLLKKHSLERFCFDSVTSSAQLEVDKPLEKLPCANVEPTKNWRCLDDGRLTCSECKLVSYCSKECQRNHWRTHKKDCKDPIRSPQWQPAWVREMRDPTFMTASTEWKIPQKEKEFALGLHIWGNIPAVDTLNLTKNEGASSAKSNFALAYVASGDLRNVVRTVNELPFDYSGELTILLNDREPMIVLRNMLLLMILGTIEDTNQAADIALHFWGSAFVQVTHQAMLSKIILQLIDELQKSESFSLKLGGKSVMTGVISLQVVFLLTRLLQFELPVNDASAEIDRIRFEPMRQDRHHRQYCLLKPSHRLASLEYRRFGIILPFGAANDNFNTPNKFLFSPEGQWLQDDLATPLESWNIEDVIAAGKVHGVQPADLYGCLYFYLSEQFRSFAERIKKFWISFQMFDEDARNLAKNISSGVYGGQCLPQHMVFDRIDVSNIIDTEYVGIPNVLADWTPLLSKNNPFSTILGYSMNWVPKQLNSEPNSDRIISKLTNKLMKMGKISQTTDHRFFPAFWKYFVALYDNSAAFNEYLKKQHTDEAACRVGVKLKSKNSIVAHRIGALIGSPSNALPQFPTEDSWYWNVQVGGALLSERFVEFAHIKSAS